MKKQYVLSEEEYQNLVPKSKLENLQKIIDRTTDECIRLAHKRKKCMKGGNRRYCLDSEPSSRDCKFARMCNSEMKKREPPDRQLDHMIE